MKTVRFIFSHKWWPLSSILRVLQLVILQRLCFSPGHLCQTELIRLQYVYVRIQLTGPYREYPGAPPFFEFLRSGPAQSSGSEKNET